MFFKMSLLIVMLSCFSAHGSLREGILNGTLSLFDARSVEEVEFLLNNKGVDVNARDSYGRTALHIHAERSNLEIIERLLKEGTDVNAQSGEYVIATYYLRNSSPSNRRAGHLGDRMYVVIKGVTPLYAAGSAAAAELLLNGDADVGIKTDLAKRISEYELDDIEDWQWESKTPLQKNKHVVTALNVLKLKNVLKLRRERSLPSCENVSGYTKLKHTQYGQRSACMADISCTFDIGLAPDSTQVTRTYQAVCSTLANGECPPAKRCVLDRFVVEADNEVAESHQSSPTRTSKGVR